MKDKVKKNRGLYFFSAGKYMPEAKLENVCGVIHNTSKQRLWIARRMFRLCHPAAACQGSSLKPL